MLEEPKKHGVIPAKAGIAVFCAPKCSKQTEIPAFAGMTPWIWQE
jgi:hypothetical protein